MVRIKLSFTQIYDLVSQQYNQEEVSHGALGWVCRQHDYDQPAT